MEKKEKKKENCSKEYLLQISPWLRGYIVMIVEYIFLTGDPASAVPGVSTKCGCAIERIFRERSSTFHVLQSAQGVTIYASQTEC